MKTASANTPSAVTLILLGCGIFSAGIYVLTDIVASALYPGFSFADQAVSELFAIGAPTAVLVVALFSIGSILLLLFALGIWQLAGSSRALRVMSVAFALSAINALVLWNLFPMHMRGEPRGFTDAMHLILGANPFVLASVIAAVVAFKNWLRITSVAVVLLVLVLASYAFHLAPALDAGEPTPGLGLSERAAQYVYQAWQVALAAVLINGARARLK